MKKLKHSCKRLRQKSLEIEKTKPRHPFSFDLLMQLKDEHSDRWVLDLISLYVYIFGLNSTKGMNKPKVYKTTGKLAKCYFWGVIGLFDEFLVP